MSLLAPVTLQMPFAAPPLPTSLPCEAAGHAIGRSGAIPADHQARINTAFERQSRICIPDDVVNLAGHDALAPQSLDPTVLAYVDGGAVDEITLEQNTRAWQRIRLATRVPWPLSGGHTRVKLLGRTLAYPMLGAPMAYPCMAHPQVSWPPPWRAPHRALAWCSAAKPPRHWKMWPGGPWMTLIAAHCGSSSTCCQTATSCSA